MEPPRWLEALAGEHGGALERAVHGDRLGAAEVEELLTEAPLHALAAAADWAARSIKRNIGSYTVNAYIAYTNVCVTACSFCAFYRPPGSPEAYTLDPRRVGALVRRLDEEHGLREVHIVGGNNPELPLDYYTRLLDEVRRAAPRAVIKAFTAEEIAFLARTHGEKTRDLLLLFKEHGLGALTGGGAETLDPRVQRLIAPKKVSPEEWLRVHEEAHRLGIRSNSTLMYGHVEEPRHVAEHLVKLRGLEERAPGFISFIPIRFNPGGTALGRTRLYRERARLDGQYDLRIVAAARLALLGAIDNIVAYWVSMGEKLAVAALSHGANDVGGTFYQESVITPARSGEKRNRGKTPEELSYMLLQAGWAPAERDTYYNYYPARIPHRVAAGLPWLRELSSEARPW